MARPRRSLPDQGGRSACMEAVSSHQKELARNARHHSRQAMRHHTEYRTRCTKTSDGSKRGSLMLKARLHPKWVPTVGYRYSVIFRSKLLVQRSRDPECDAARAIMVKGI